MRVAAVLVHGRDQDAAYMREHLVGPLDRPDVAYILPEAPGRSWYAGRFNAPVADLEPELSAALETIAGAVRRAGQSADAVVLAGFSQGACLVAELLAREGAAGLSGAAILTGAFIGAREREDEERALPGGLHGFPVELVSSETDGWVGPAYVRATAQSLEAAGATVRVQITGEPEHRIDDIAVAAVAGLLRRASAGAFASRIRNV
jgi:phospholipase/carboxylesterase